MTDPKQVPGLLDALAAGRRIEALSLYRAFYGTGVASALEAIDALPAATEEPDTGDEQPIPAQSTTPAAPAGASAGPEGIAEALRRGRKIEAIKIYYNHHGVSLLEAKQAVEAMLDGTFDSASTPAADEPDPNQLAPDDPIIVAMRNQRKIEAIKLYRERFGSGLSEAKQAVEALTIPPLPRAPEPMDDPMARVRELVAAGQKILAIKTYRELTNVGLKEAKDAVEAME